jgi:hypothetical protein
MEVHPKQCFDRRFVNVEELPVATESPPFACLVDDKAAIDGSSTLSAGVG